MKLEDTAEIRESAEHKDAFAIALGVHQKDHDPTATHFRDCVECRCGYALLLIANLEQARNSICIPPSEVLSS